MTSIVDVYKTQRAGNEVVIDRERDGYDNCNSVISNLVTHCLNVKSTQAGMRCILIISDT